MADPATVLQLFPENGLDRSLHAPVYIGLLFMVFFRETLGWGFAGLVVPGYLATVLIAAPITGALVVVEAIITYIVALLLGRTLPRTGAWFTFFGRERFLLLIAAASLTRLAIEGSLLPAITSRWNLIHSRELYSLGLVLVPLLANSFWNAGFVRAFPRVSTVTALTYLIVSELLLPYTNFTLSRFQVANESVSLAFLESPHAHIILLVGAVLGARNNVRYGWDYNGILVPALLAVAWYQPSKVATTLMEALVVYYGCLWLIRRRPFSRMMFVGCRRVVLTFSVGFAIKYVSGLLLVRWLPEVQLIDFFGFGYLLPSLLANKMWDRGGVPKVLMPTLQVSIIAFPIGAMLGYGLRALEPERQLTAAAVLEVTPSVPWSLLLGDTAPSPDRSGTTLRLADPYGVARELSSLALRGGLDARALELASRGQLRIARSESGAWAVISPAAHDPNVDVPAPRVAVRTERRYGDDWLVLVDAPEVGSPGIPIAFALAERIGGRAVVLLSRFETLHGQDEELARTLAQELEMPRVLRVSLRAGPGGPALSAVGRLPAGTALRLFEDVLGAPVELVFRAPDSARAEDSSELRLSISEADAQLSAEKLVGSPPLESWALENDAALAARLTELSYSAPGAYRVPSIPELRMYGAVLSSGLFSAAEPSVWQRALAGRLGLSFARVGGIMTGHALFEPTGPARAGHPTVIVRAAARAPADRVALTLAAPRWMIGGVDATVRLNEVFEADALIVHGALVNAADDLSSDPRRPAGRQSFFQRAHETWLNAGGQTVLLRGIPDTRSVTTDAVVTFDSEVNDIVEGPGWAGPLIQRLARAGVTLAAVDGSAERAGFDASLDPGVAYGRRFAAGRTFVLWLSGDLRRALRQAYTDAATERRLELARLPSLPLDPAAFARSLSGCARAAGSGSCPAPRAAPGCERASAVERLERFMASQNPYYLDAAFATAAHCGWVVLNAAATRTRWLALPPAPDASRAPRGADRHWLMLPLVRAVEESRREDRGAPRVSGAQLGEIAAIALGPIELETP